MLNVNRSSRHWVGHLVLSAVAALGLAACSRGSTNDVPTAAPATALAEGPVALKAAAPVAAASSESDPATAVAPVAPTSNPPTAAASAAPAVAEGGPGGAGEQPAAPAPDTSRAPAGSTASNPATDGARPAPNLGMPAEPHPLQIAWLRAREYPGSDFVVERNLEPGSNYSRQVVSYRSDGLKIYALLTIPNGERPPTGWPVVVFNHGYIPPAQYRTTERYIAYTDAFSRNGYIVVRSDYRGHGSSEGRASGGYGSPDYTVDVLNALASIKRHPDADPNRIAMWGHSMGGHITLRAMVVDKDIKAGDIWAGVVASYTDRMAEWRRREAANPSPPTDTRRRWRTELADNFGTPEENPAFWASLSPNSYLSELSGPIQLQHGTADSSVPYAYSEKLFADLQAIGWPSALFTYPGDNHNLSANLSQALQRSVAFFDQHVKGGG